MDSGLYVIILFLIFLKLMIWICVFYSRARRRQIISQRGGLIIVQGEVSADTVRDRDVIIHREHLPGIYTGGVDNPGITNLPSYEEVQRTKNMEEKPPSYEQVVSGNLFQQGTQLSGYSTQPSGNVPQSLPCNTEVGQTTTESNSSS